MGPVDLTIEQLSLDSENPRIDSASSQREALQKVIADEPDKLVRLARSITKRGLNPMDRMFVFRPKGTRTYIVVEGSLAENVDLFGWLNNLYELLNTAQRLDLFDTLRLLPDQMGTLRTRSALKIDEGIDDALKEVAARLRLRIREQLLDRRVDVANIPKLPKTTEEDLLGQLLQAVASRHETDRGTQTYQEANVQLFAWLLDGRRERSTVCALHG